VVNATPRPLYLREWPGTHRTGGWVAPPPRSGWVQKSRPNGIWSPDHLAHSKSLYRPSYRGPHEITNKKIIYIYMCVCVCVCVCVWILLAWRRTWERDGFITWPIETERIYRVLVGKCEWMTFGRRRLRWEDNIKMEFQEITKRGCEMDWSGTAQEYVAGCWKHGNKNFEFSSMVRTFLTSFWITNFSRKTPLHAASCTHRRCEGLTDTYCKSDPVTGPVWPRGSVQV